MKEYIIALAAFAVIFLAAVLVLGYFKRRYDSDNAKLEADRAKYEAITKAKELCEKLLAQVTLALFTEAERKFGNGTGKLKMSYVLERFLALLPRLGAGTHRPRLACRQTRSPAPRSERRVGEKHKAAGYKQN